MIDFLTGSYGALAFYGMITSVALVMVMAAANLLFGLSEKVRRVGEIIAVATGTPIVLWLPSFYGSALFYGNFDGDWRGIAFCLVMTAFSLPMAALPFLAMRRVLTSSVAGRP
jgi:hypothetical protein